MSDYWDEGEYERRLEKQSVSDPMSARPVLTAMTADEIADVRAKANAPAKVKPMAIMAGDVMITILCDSHEQLRAEVARLEGVLEKCAYRSAGFQQELKELRARREATEQELCAITAWLHENPGTGAVLKSDVIKRLRERKERGQ